MGENTKIEWATHTFNPWIGCTKVSPACAHCYAEINTATRTRGVKWGAGQPRYRTADANWKKPLAWDREAKALGVRHRVFSASLADWLDDEVDVNWLADLLVLIQTTPNLDWLLLTKRPENCKTRMLAACESLGSSCRDSDEGAHKMVVDWLDGNGPGNVWIGCTVENQEWADKRIPALLRIPARVRFLSCEPLLGPVDLDVRFWDKGYSRMWPKRAAERIHWVIAGGESGHHARPSHPDWFRALRDQCAAAGAAFFFKQWGEWVAGDHVEQLPDHAPKRICKLATDGTQANTVTMPYAKRDGMKTVCLVGKKVSGRLLDGREWNEVPALGGGRDL